MRKINRIIGALAFVLAVTICFGSVHHAYADVIITDNFDWSWVGNRENVDFNTEETGDNPDKGDDASENANANNMSVDKSEEVANSNPTGKATAGKDNLDLVPIAIAGVGVVSAVAITAVILVIQSKKKRSR